MLCTSTSGDPASNSITATCTSVRASRQYNVTLQLQYSGPWFTPVALEAYSCVRLARVEYDSRDAPVPGGNGDFPSGCSFSLALQSSVTQTVRPLEPGHSYYFSVSFICLFVCLFYLDVGVCVRPKPLNEIN